MAIGSAQDPRLSFVAEGATRYFYAGDDAATSSRSNAVDIAQILYYDVYPPTGPGNATTALYLHGGALNTGYANADDSVAACRLLTQLGSWCISIEYRRGYAAFASLGDRSPSVSAAEADRYLNALALARSDALDAWRHADALAPTVGMPQRYVVFGDGSGATIAADIVMTGDPLPYDILGLMLNAGAPAAGQPIAPAQPYPVVIHAGLLDPIAPAYSAPFLFDGDMPLATGLIDLYNDLAANNTPVRMYLEAQRGHIANLSPAVRVADFAAALSLFLTGGPSGALAAAEYRFACADAGFGAAGPGVRINTVQFPDFRYEPYESDLEAGLSPADSLQLHPLEASDCQT